MTHTPGPWEAIPANEHHGAYVVNHWGSTVCDLYTMSNPSVPSVRNGGDSFPVPFFAENADANARLIAQSPYLVEQAEFLLARLAEFESELRDDEIATQFFGHVKPAMERLQETAARATTASKEGE